nr:uncharacterized protein LOC109178682 isoform X2 [Ipomoea batatas]
MLELVELLHEAEMTIDTSDDSAKLMDTTRALLGICPTYDAQPQAPPPAAWPSSTYIDDDFYSNPNFFKAVEEIERVVHERNALSNVPSFSLGLSQDVGMSQVEHMITIGTVAPRERAHAGGIEQARAKRSAVSKSRAKANHNTVAPAAHQISGAPPSIPPSSIVDGYFTIPLPVGRGPINKVTHKLYRTPHKACTNESAKTTAGGTSPTNSSGKKHVTQCAPVERMPYMDCADRDLRVPMDFRQPRGTNVDLLSTFLDDKYETELASEIRERVASWDTGLQKGDISQLCSLRKYIMRKILMSDTNIHQASNIKRALNFANGLARRTSVPLN